jgi:hypothetical protein
MVAMGADIQPVADVLGCEQAAHQFILFPAAVPFGCTEHDTHLPEVWVLIARDEVYGIIVIDIIIIISIYETADVKNAAHREAMAGDSRVPESEIGCMIASEAAAGRGNTVVSCLMANSWIYVFQKKLIVQSMLVSSFAGRDGFVVPALGVDAVGAIDLYFPVFQEPSGCFDEALILVLVVAALGSGEKDDGVARMAESQHLKFPANGGGVPSMVFFL